MNIKTEAFERITGNSFFCLFCFFPVWGPQLCYRGAGTISWHLWSISRQKGLCLWSDCIWRGRKWICLHLLRKCISHFHIGPKEKVFGQGWSFFLGRLWLLNKGAKGERHRTPVFPSLVYNTCEYSRERQGSACLQRWSAPGISVPPHPPGKTA